MREDPQMMQEYLDEVNHDLEEFLCTTLEGYRINNILLSQSDLIIPQSHLPRGQKLGFEEIYQIGSPHPIQQFVQRVVAVAQSLAQDIQWGLGAVVWVSRPRVSVADEEDGTLIMFGSARFVDRDEARRLQQMENARFLEATRNWSMFHQPAPLPRFRKVIVNSPVGAWNS